MGTRQHSERYVYLNIAGADHPNVFHGWAFYTLAA